MKVVLIDYGAGNLFSVKVALERLGCVPVVSRSADEIRSAEKVVLPGVGHADSAMNALASHGLVEVVRETTVPFLGICLGMQLLFGSTEEGDTPCIGVCQEKIRLLTETKRTPHMGWNTVRSITDGGILSGVSGEYFYFCHSYAVPVVSVTSAITSVDEEEFSASIQHNNFYGVQFHPEKSGDAGMSLLENFIRL